MLALPALGLAADAPLTAEAVQTNVNFVWTLVAAFLVFIMQAGFAMVESGFTRAKNACNIMMKNMMDFCVGALAYWAVGFGLMFGIGTGFFGHSDFFLSGAVGDGASWNYAFWMFQVVFAATAATIISGAVAERTKFSAYIIYSVLVSLILYPVFGALGLGQPLPRRAARWLAKLGFIDFAGSTVVHSMGGWLALAGAIVVGPRIGKFAKDGKVKPIPGHNIPLASLGVFLLFFGWFGFNPGSTTAGDPRYRRDCRYHLPGRRRRRRARRCSTPGCAIKKPDVGMTLNGLLAGLVAITAGCANVTPLSAVIIGLVAGVLVVLSVVFFDKIQVDDPVGAVSVHGVCGAWGTLAAGLFDTAGFSLHTVGVQLLGIGACFVWAFGTGMVVFKAIDLTIGMRVSEEEELAGLDFSEHGASAYPDFQTVHLGSIFTPGGNGGSGKAAVAREATTRPVTQS